MINIHHSYCSPNQSCSSVWPHFSFPLNLLVRHSPSVLLLLYSNAQQQFRCLPLTCITTGFFIPLSGIWQFNQNEKKKERYTNTETICRSHRQHYKTQHTFTCSLTHQLSPADAGDLRSKEKKICWRADVLQRTWASYKKAIFSLFSVPLATFSMWRKPFQWAFSGFKSLGKKKKNMATLTQLRWSLQHKAFK